MTSSAWPLASGDDGLGHALVVGTPINAPFTFVAVKAAAVLAATRHRAGERAIQLALVAATLTLGGFAIRAALATSRFTHWKTPSRWIRSTRSNSSSR